MKYEQIHRWFTLPIKGKPRTVRPYNAETTTRHKQDVSWSQGFTSFEIKETRRTGYCGIHWFEDHAK
jgi:hypothetical protein